MKLSKLHSDILNKIRSKSLIILADFNGEISLSWYMNPRTFRLLVKRGYIEKSGKGFQPVHWVEYEITPAGLAALEAEGAE